MHFLYVVATPIGNLEDISIRAIKTLLTVPVIACEDTRRTGQLIKILEEKYSNSFLNPPPDSGGGNKKEGVYRKYISVRDWNEAQQINNILTELINSDVALVSDAGTPLLSDPGFKVVRAVLEAGYRVIPIPGPFAGATAVSVAGLPTDKLVFRGFLPKKFSLDPGATNIIYESPKRITKLLQKLKNDYPEAKIVIARELTKIHEYIGPDDGLTNKGEAVVLVYLPGVKVQEQVTAVHT
jgi:16S rRNA (cytidine1402-2'-O)-methyltransferase